ncbi:MAG: HDOD domain-containing protein [Gammaproteobacteria bacterium]|jgi:HD-like signal output (HDOD) protein
MTQEASQIAATAVVDDLSWLVSPPHVYFRVLELIQATDTSAEDIAEVIRQDPSLTTRLLKVVNSSFYNFSARIDTVSRAVAVVGTRSLQLLVTAVCALDTFAKIETNLVSMGTFWRHSFYAGLIARGLAKRCRVLHPERLFVAGLLHDIGSLVLYVRAPDVSKRLLLIADGDEQALHRAELKTLGFSHAELGGDLLKSWMLPETLHKAVRWHHNPKRAGIGCFDASVVHVADGLANRSRLTAFCERPAEVIAIEAHAWETLSQERSELNQKEVVDEATFQLAEIELFFGY